MSIGIAEKIRRLQERCRMLEQRVTDLEQDSPQQPRDTVSFVEWSETKEDGYRVARATFGKYFLDVIDGYNAVTWSIQEGKMWVACGGGHSSFDFGMSEAEEALRRLVNGGGEGDADRPDRR